MHRLILKFFEKDGFSFKYCDFLIVFRDNLFGHFLVEKHIVEQNVFKGYGGVVEYNGS